MRSVAGWGFSAPRIGRAARAALKGLAAPAIGFAGADPAMAHGFQERYDLAVPLSFVVTGACLAVVLTFVASALFRRRRLDRLDRPFGIEVAVPRAVWCGTRTLGWLLLMLTLVAALWGSGDALMNLAPTLVMVVWWVGLALLAACIGNVWVLLDPWRSTFDAMEAGARRLGRPEGITLGLRWPDALGMWPATALLLVWCWLEVVYPLASSPFKLGCGVLLWTVLNIGGMVVFGRSTWQGRADVFALVFATVGRMAPIRLRIDQPRSPTNAAPAGHVGFVIALLSTVVFDGLHSGSAWRLFEGMVQRMVPSWIDVNGYVVGTAGLLAVWLFFLLAYVVAVRLSVLAMGSAVVGADRARLAADWVVSLVPVAVAYNLAHNFSSLVLQGQTVAALLSDPFGRQWDLFGTARFYPDIGIVDARLTWFVAVGAIVAGHCVSIVWSHRLALGAGWPERRAAVALLPLTILMVAYTAVSLTLISQPMVVEGH